MIFHKNSLTFKRYKINFLYRFPSKKKKFFKNRKIKNVKKKILKVFIKKLRKNQLLRIVTIIKLKKLFLVKKKKKKRKKRYKFFSPSIKYLNQQNAYRFKYYQKNKLQKLRYLRLFFNFNKKKKLINFFENKKFESKYNWLFSKNYFLFSLLERRLDLLIYRAGFVFSLYEARQYISHGFICLNLAILKNNLFILKRGDIISLNFNLRKRLRYKKLFFFNKRLLKRSLISYKHFEANHLTFKIILIANLVNRKQSMVFLKKKINFTLSFI